MKSIIVLTLQFILYTLCSAQKLEQFYDWQWRRTEPNTARYYALLEKDGDLWLRRDYFIHERRLQMEGFYTDSSSNTPQGPFRYYHSNGSLKSVGRYEGGKKQGLWLSYHPNGMMSDSAYYEKGEVVGTRMQWHSNGFPSDSAVYNRDGSGVAVSWFDNGSPSAAGKLAAGYKQHGRWRHFHKNGQTSSLEEYENGRLVSRQYYTEDGTEVKDTASTDRVAAPKGGIESWKNYLSKNIYFPSQLRLTNADKAIVIVDWYVDEEGNIKDPFISSPLHPNFDRIVLKSIQRAPKWIPARSHNRNIKTFHRQPITFVQQ